MEIFELEFLRIALIATIFAAISSAIISPVVVFKKMEFIGDGTAHAAFAGLAFAFLFGIDYRLIAILTALLFSFLISYFTNKRNIHENSAIGMLLPVFMSIGVILLSKSNTYAQDISSYLFGDILLVNYIDIYFLIFVILSEILLFFIFRKEILYFLADEKMANFYGVKTNLLRIILLGIISITVVSVVKISGVILLGALLIVPGLVAKKFSKSYKSVYFISISFNVIVSFIGFYIAYIFDIAPGPSIVIVSFTTFLILSSIN
ncbi:metal ABC transporter permease [Thermosipho melanesiensis]|uniref:ABC-3 protein n=2 Tax=Thermosipho melanesiensis TaxID=46541 RepID=A6LK51_THEM4|nr:metal ABC transporter permease [Thermosipho melanesiensis]ABR30302.1 ABC-3 protein [Thermosipho melanesiensis BI429]OOC37424.1 metal ABC transporter permease [Thermosipho melanesiensis]OOC39786.1 metal ABC transporter permease [Thermosipho melanesiensis]OOC39891.1 metal ABC transporter permease [Thermosipho melanesiensis]OOC43819.1 metal ABC transporter permease [Thermosipho melanesiensis]